PFYVALPWSTFDPGCPDGASIPIEERGEDEVLIVNGGPVGPPSTRARNWGFDVTPARFVTGFLTPTGRIAPPDMAAAAPR
ncbi:MAG: S-methyl-5-thioribose-1-phosphate isomerase, partial [Actinobacteria bacterium]|nr:S-methyl-5-thioribose-1-phosphate isomerase [Actinomycetota bacterium]